MVLMYINVASIRNSLSNCYGLKLFARKGHGIPGSPQTLVLTWRSGPRPKLGVNETLILQRAADSHLTAPSRQLCRVCIGRT